MRLNSSSFALTLNRDCSRRGWLRVRVLGAVPQSGCARHQSNRRCLQRHHDWQALRRVLRVRGGFPRGSHTAIAASLHVVHRLVWLMFTRTSISSSSRSPITQWRNLTAISLVTSLSRERFDCSLRCQRFAILCRPFNLAAVGDNLDQLVVTFALCALIVGARRNC